MSYRIVSDAQAMESANNKLLQSLRNHSNYTKRLSIGFRPKSVETDIFWNTRNNIWFTYFERVNHYWIAFGINPHKTSNTLNIVTEINTPRLPNHGRAGQYLKDQIGRIYLAHTGRIGGGKSGINKTMFLKYYQQNHSLTTLQSGKPIIVIGALDDKNLASKIYDFVVAVSDFKSQA